MDVSVSRVLDAFLAGPAEGPDAEALADLILAALQHGRLSQLSMGSVIAPLVMSDTWDAAREKLPNGHAGNLVNSASMQQRQADHESQHEPDSVEAAQQHMSSLGVSGESNNRQQSAAGIGAGDSKAAAGPEEDAHLLTARPHSSMPSYSAADEELGNSKQGACRGCLTHACTLLSRMGAHSEQMRDNEQLWRADMLGLAAKHLAQPDVLLLHPHAAKVALGSTFAGVQMTHIIALQKLLQMMLCQQLQVWVELGGVWVIKNSRTMPLEAHFRMPECCLHAGAGIADEGKWRPILPGAEGPFRHLREPAAPPGAWPAGARQPAHPLQPQAPQRAAAAARRGARAGGHPRPGPEPVQRSCPGAVCRAAPPGLPAAARGVPAGLPARELHAGHP